MIFFLKKNTPFPSVPTSSQLPEILPKNFPLLTAHDARGAIQINMHCPSLPQKLLPSLVETEDGVMIRPSFKRRMKGTTL